MAGSSGLVIVIVLLLVGFLCVCALPPTRWMPSFPSSTPYCSLAGMKLATLPVLDGMQDCLTLNLSNNLLSSLPADAFTGASNLQQLILSNNSLQLLPSSVFQGLSALTLLHLDGNRLTSASLTPGLLTVVPNLLELSLSNNLLEAVPNGIFDALSQLRTLQLDGNLIANLSDADGVLDGDVFPLPSLQSLILADNGMMYVDYFACAFLFVITISCSVGHSVYK
jgi:hypothetical protein